MNQEYVDDMYNIFLDKINYILGYFSHLFQEKTHDLRAKHSITEETLSHFINNLGPVLASIQKSEKFIKNNLTELEETDYSFGKLIHFIAQEFTYDNTPKRSLRPKNFLIELLCIQIEDKLRALFREQKPDGVLFLPQFIEKKLNPYMLKLRKSIKKLRSKEKTDPNLCEVLNNFAMNFFLHDGEFVISVKNISSSEEALDLINNLNFIMVNRLRIRNEALDRTILLDNHYNLQKIETDDAQLLIKRHFLYEEHKIPNKFFKFNLLIFDYMKKLKINSSLSIKVFEPNFLKNIAKTIKLKSLNYMEIDDYIFKQYQGTLPRYKMIEVPVVKKKVEVVKGNLIDSGNSGGVPKEIKVENHPKVYDPPGFNGLKIVQPSSPTISDDEPDIPSDPEEIIIPDPVVPKPFEPVIIQDRGKIKEYHFKGLRVEITHADKKKTRRFLEEKEVMEEEIYFGKGAECLIRMYSTNISPCQGQITFLDSSFFLTCFSMQTLTYFKLSPRLRVRLHKYDYFLLGEQSQFTVDDIFSSPPTNASDFYSEGWEFDDYSEFDPKPYKLGDNGNTIIIKEKHGGSGSEFKARLEMEPFREFTFGTAKEADFQLTPRAGISNLHFRIGYELGFGWYIADGIHQKPSTNGTLLALKNWQSIIDKENSEPFLIRNNMEVQVGDTKLMVIYDYYIYNIVPRKGDIRMQRSRIMEIHRLEITEWMIERCIDKIEFLLVYLSPTTYICTQYQGIFYSMLKDFHRLIQVQTAVLKMQKTDLEEVDYALGKLVQFLVQETAICKQPNKNIQPKNLGIDLFYFEVGDRIRALFGQTLAEDVFPRGIIELNAKTRLQKMSRDIYTMNSHNESNTETDLLSVLKQFVESYYGEDKELMEHIDSIKGKEEASNILKNMEVILSNREKEISKKIDRLQIQRNHFQAIKYFTNPRVMVFFNCHLSYTPSPISSEFVRDNYYVFLKYETEKRGITEKRLLEYVEDKLPNRQREALQYKRINDLISQNPLQELLHDNTNKLSDQIPVEPKIIVVNPTTVLGEAPIPMSKNIIEILDEQVNVPTPVCPEEEDEEIDLSMEMEERGINIPDDTENIIQRKETWATIFDKGRFEPISIEPKNQAQKTPSQEEKKMGTSTLVSRFSFSKINTPKEYIDNSESPGSTGCFGKPALTQGPRLSTFGQAVQEHRLRIKCEWGDEVREFVLTERDVLSSHLVFGSAPECFMQIQKYNLGAKQAQIIFDTKSNKFYIKCLSTDILTLFKVPNDTRVKLRDKNCFLLGQQTKFVVEDLQEHEKCVIFEPKHGEDKLLDPRPSAPMAKLSQIPHISIAEGLASGRKIIFETLLDKEYLFGVHREADNQLPPKDGISDRHCRVGYCNQFGWYIIDGVAQSSSTHGTYLAIKSYDEYINNLDSLPFLLEGVMQFFVADLKLTVLYIYIYI